MTRGFERPPWWAVVVIVLGGAGLAFGLLFLVPGRGAVPAETVAAARASAEASRASAAAARESAAAAEAARIDIAALGDSYTGGSAMDSGLKAEWPALLTAQYPWNVQPFAVGGTGFVNRAEEGTEFTARVADVVAAKPDVVIVEGGHNDSSQPQADVETAIRQVLSELRAGLPEARIVVLGVLWPGEAPASVFAINDALRDASADAGATFVDALNEGWFDGENQALIGSDGTHPTDEGHAALAQRIAAALAAAGVPATV